MEKPSAPPCRWLAKDFERERRKIETEFSAWTDDVEAQGRIIKLKDDVLARLDALDALEQMRAFLYVLAALRFDKQRKVLKTKATRELHVAGETLLRNARIRPGVSKLSYLYEELYSLRAGSAVREGERLRGSFLHRFAKQAAAGGAETDVAWHLARAGDSLRLGQALQALQAIDALECRLPGEHQEPVIVLARLRAKRLAGDPVGATATLSLAEDLASGWGDDAKATLSWEAARLKAAENGPEAFLPALRLGVGPEQSLEAFLWAHAWKHRHLEHRVETPQPIRRRFKLIDAPHRALLECATLLHACYDDKTSLSASLEGIASALEQIKSATEIDHELVFYAAVLRWLVRARQQMFADLVAGEYRGLCLKLTGGAKPDLLGVFDDLFGKIELKSLGLTSTDLILPAQDAARPLTGNWETSLAVARVLTEALQLSVKGLIGKRFVDANSRSDVELKTQRDIARVLSRFARRRRGVILKLGQILSYHDTALHEIVRQEFDVIEAEIASTPPDAVRQIVEGELGGKLEERFRRFDLTPFANGSIGQVHYAVGHDGRPLAVKVQYPGIRRLIEFDFRQAWLLKPLFKASLPSTDFDELVREALAQVLRETDYRKELNAQREFAEMFATEPEILIPGVHPELSSAKVLTTDFIEGRNFNDFVATASQAEKDRAGALMMRMHMKSMIGRGVIHADPQPANYLFLDDKVALLDFGCVRHFSRTFHRLRNESIRAFFLGDREKLMELQIRLGLLPKGVPIDVDGVWRLHEIVFRPCLSHAPFRFTSAYVREENDTQTVHHPHRRQLRVSPDQVAASRFDFGFFQLLGRLEAAADWRELLMAELFRH